jgi:hypothetical protein
VHHAAWFPPLLRITHHTLVTAADLSLLGALGWPTLAVIAANAIAANVVACTTVLVQPVGLEVLQSSRTYECSTLMVDIMA